MVCEMSSSDCADARHALALASKAETREEALDARCRHPVWNKTSSDSAESRSMPSALMPRVKSCRRRLMIRYCGQRLYNGMC
jgi:hypothetical protein